MPKNDETEVIDVEQPSPSDELATHTSGGQLELQRRSPDEVAARLLKKQLDATSLDDLFDVATGNTSDKMIGKTIEVLSVEWDTYESSDRGSVPMAIMQYVDVATGEIDEFVSTAASIVGFVYKANQAGWLPFRVKIEEFSTSRGQKALRFVRP